MDSKGVARVGLVAGAVAFAVMLALPAPGGLEPGAWRTAAVGVLMAVWWMTEAVPIPATALVPLVLFPPLGIAGIGGTAAPYANPVIFLFMGGFMLALGVEKWDLHRRVALGVVAAVGTQPMQLVGGFMAATALLSMWVSNTAAVVMMLPVAMSVVTLTRAQSEAGASRGFGVALLLGIAYSSSLGGIGTLIGTPPNALLAGFLSEVYGVELGFAEWMMFGVPLVVVSVPLAWLVLVRLYGVHRLPAGGGAAAVRAEKAALGPFRVPERRVAVVAVSMALAWTFQPLLGRVVLGLSDAGIAMAGAVLLFLLPAGNGGAGERGNGAAGERLLEWGDTERLPWGVLVLFGGGLSLAAAIQDTGLAVWIGGALNALAGVPVLVMALVVTALIVFLTELTSNTATAAAFLPIVGAAAVTLGVPPAMLAVPAAVAASCAFMMPVATPPNALVYGAGDVTMADMIRAGFWLNLLMIGLITVLVGVFGRGVPGAG